MAVSTVQEPEELFETVTQCLMSGADRDALSGWGAIVYVMCALSALHGITLCAVGHGDRSTSEGDASRALGNFLEGAEH